jgi:hypothetical protein
MLQTGFQVAIARFYGGTPHPPTLLEWRGPSSRQERSQPTPCCMTPEQGSLDVLLRALPWS